MCRGVSVWCDIWLARWKSQFSVTTEGLKFSDLLLPPRCFYLATGLKTSDHQTERGEDRQKNTHLLPSLSGISCPATSSSCECLERNTGEGRGMLCGVWLRCALITQAGISLDLLRYTIKHRSKELDGFGFVRLEEIRCTHCSSSTKFWIILPHQLCPFISASTLLCLKACKYHGDTDSVCVCVSACCWIKLLDTHATNILTLTTTSNTHRMMVSHI